MNIAEMHVWFRQYAQQMGMQNVRAILPEQIDLLINTSITDITNHLIRENIGIVNDRIITDNVKLNQINALKTLYKVSLIDLVPNTPIATETRTFNFSASDKLTGKITTDFIGVGNTTEHPVTGSDKIPPHFFLVDFSINYRKCITGYVGKNVTTNAYCICNPDSTIYKYDVNSGDIFVLSVIDSDNYGSGATDMNIQVKIEGSDANLVELESGKKIFIVSKTDQGASTTPYYIMDDENGTVAAGTSSYGSVVNPLQSVLFNRDYVKPAFDEDSEITNFFPVRIINDSFLADTLNDHVLKNRLRSPIIVTYNNGVFDLYIDKFVEEHVGLSTFYHLKNNLIPYQLRMSYVAKPAEVHYDEDLAGENVDCDLPESLHVDILKHAVDLYSTSVRGGLYNSQEQQQLQNRETVRNEARPDNDGYQN